MMACPADRSKFSKSTASRLRRYHQADGPCSLLPQSVTRTKLSNRAALLDNFEIMGQGHFLPNTRQYGARYTGSGFRAAATQPLTERQTLGDTRFRYHGLS